MEGSGDAFTLETFAHKIQFYLRFRHEILTFLELVHCREQTFEKLQALVKLIDSDAFFDS